MDGVLVYSEPTHFNAWNLVLADLGIESGFEFEEMVGRSDFVLAEILVERHQLPHSIEALSHQKRHHVVRLVDQGLQAPLGRNEFLAKVAKDYYMAVVSSSSRNEVMAILEAENIASYFKHIITADDVDAVKPHPEPYLKALSEANCEAHEALIIEDSISGLQAAKNANIKALGMHSEVDVAEVHPDITIFQDFSEIHDHLFEI